MDKVYVGRIGIEFRVDCVINIASATSTKLAIKKPSGVIVEWVGSIYSGTYISYETIADDLDEAGTYRLQALVTLDGNEMYGETTKFDIDELFD